MNYYISVITLIILICLIVQEVRIWKLRVLFCPGFYFGVIWSFGALGVTLLSPMGLLYEPYPEYIDELNILVTFTALCFIFWSKKGRERINKYPINIDISLFRVYKVLSIVLLLAAISDFIRLGGNINMGAARDNLQQIQQGRSVFVNYALSLALPLSIYAGNYFMKIVINNIRLSKLIVLYLIIPLFANLIFSINVGGRVDIVYCFAYYLIGAAFALPSNFNLKTNKKPILLIVASALAIMLFISSVANQRQKFNQGVRDEVEVFLTSKSPILGAIYGPIQYIVASYNGYQLRRVDAVDPNKLGYGMYTFNGFINWTLPFSSQIGLGDFSIAKTLGIYYYNQETYDNQRELYYTTHSCYLTIIKDYGFWGALFCIFILTMVAHKLFVNIQNRYRINHAYSLYFFYLFWDYWAHSNFYGSLSSTVLIPLYGFLIIDIANYFTKR